MASDNALASAAGVAALKGGGNAIDAACATALALGVVHPDSSGIGGGGFAIVYLAKEKKSYALDFRERAPAAITPAAYFKDGKVQPELSKRGGLAVAVPGEVRGLGEHGEALGQAAVQPLRRRRRRSWPRAGSPSPGGWRRTWARSIARRPATRSSWRCSPASRSPRGRSGGGPSSPGRWASCARAAPTPSTRARWPKEIVKAVASAGGVLTRRGSRRLHGDRARRRSPTDYRGLRVYSMPPSSSGGVVLIETLGILAAHYPTDADLQRDGRGSSAYLHVVSPRRSSTASPIARAFSATPTSSPSTWRT